MVGVRGRSWRSLRASWYTAEGLYGGTYITLMWGATVNWIDFPEGGRKDLELCPTSWPQGPAWGDIEMPLEVTPSDLWARDHYGHSENITNTSISHLSLFWFSESRELSQPDYIDLGPCP